MSRNEKLDAALASLYSHVPDIPDCDGRCADLCCRQPVEQSDREYARAPIGTDSEERCAHLGADLRCWVYERRPMLCRLWGTSETLPCPYGCKPSARLSPEQEFALFVYSLAVGGGTRVGWPQVFDPERVMAAYRADAGGVRTRFLAQRERARADLTSRAIQGQRGPVPRRATGDP